MMAFSLDIHLIIWYSLITNKLVYLVYIVDIGYLIAFLESMQKCVLLLL